MSIHTKSKQTINKRLFISRIYKISHRVEFELSLNTVMEMIKNGPEIRLSQLMLTRKTLVLDQLVRQHLISIIYTNLIKTDSKSPL